MLFMSDTCQALFVGDFKNIAFWDSLVKECMYKRIAFQIVNIVV